MQLGRGCKASLVHLGITQMCRKRLAASTVHVGVLGPLVASGLGVGCFSMGYAWSTVVVTIGAIVQKVNAFWLPGWLPAHPGRLMQTDLPAAARASLLLLP